MPGAAKKRLGRAARAKATAEEAAAVAYVEAEAKAAAQAHAKSRQSRPGPASLFLTDSSAASTKLLLIQLRLAGFMGFVADMKAKVAEVCSDNQFNEEKMQQAVTDVQKAIEVLVGIEMQTRELITTLSKAQAAGRQHGYTTALGTLKDIGRLQSLIKKQINELRRCAEHGRSA
jgi:hypothetical protein